MISVDRGALACDLAETYGILDDAALPARKLAMLAAGLRDDSRIKMKMCGRTVTMGDMLLAAAVDKLSMLVWQNSEDGRKGEKRPASILSVLLGEPQEGESDIQAFETGEDFQKEWIRRNMGVENG